MNPPDRPHLPSRADGSCESGRSMLELLLVIAVVAILSVGALRSQLGYQSNIKDESAAQQMRDVVNAASAYIQANAATVDANAAAGPTQITTAMLQAANYLPATFQNTNPFGQSYVVLVRQISAGVDQALVVTTGGALIADNRLPQIAGRIGSDGGYIAASSPTLAQGAFGGWQAATTPFNASGVTPSAGHLAATVFFNNNTILSDYLYRFPVPGQPDANRMHTALDMNANNITGAGTVTATAVSIGGQTLGTTQATAVTQLANLDCAAGQVLTRQGGSVVCVQPNPPAGTVAGFTTACPTGWTALANSAGRFLVGTGTGPFGNTYALLQTGGVSTVTIQRSNVPFDWSGQSPVITAASTYPGTGVVVGNASPTPIDVRPSYLAVNWCQKN
jgi:type II secretory pathway pseudopilin PulG